MPDNYTAKVLRERLGTRYEITTHGTGSQESLKVKQTDALRTFATVRMERGGNATVFNVHGGGSVILRMINELGIAKMVTAAIKEAFGTPPADVTSN